MKGYRYELSFFEEPQNIGIFQGLNSLDFDLEIQEKISELIFKDFKELIVPEKIYKEYKDNTIYSYFTEEGNNFFEKQLLKLKKFYKYNNFDVILIIEEISEENIVYKDNYQILKKETF